MPAPDPKREAACSCQRKPARGFTLVELLVVVIVLAVIAVIVIPKLSASTKDANIAALDSNLARLRSAIEHYRVDHGVYPGKRTASGGSCGGTGGTGTVTSPAQRAITMAEQLTMYTNPGGKACSRPGLAHRFGPYLKTAELGPVGMPSNPLTGSDAVKVVMRGTLDLLSSSTTGGWLYDVPTGGLRADHSAYDDR